MSSTPYSRACGYPGPKFLLGPVHSIRTFKRNRTVPNQFETSLENCFEAGIHPLALTKLGFSSENEAKMYFLLWYTNASKMT